MRLMRRPFREMMRATICKQAIDLGADLPDQRPTTTKPRLRPPLSASGVSIAPNSAFASTQIGGYL